MFRWLIPDRPHASGSFWPPLADTPAPLMERLPRKNDWHRSPRKRPGIDAIGSDIDDIGRDIDGIGPDIDGMSLDVDSDRV